MISFIKAFLISLEAIILDIILRAFIKELNNFKTRKKIIRDMTSTNRFLNTIYNFIEKLYRINIEIQRLYEKKNKIEEL